MTVRPRITGGLPVVLVLLVALLGGLIPARAQGDIEAVRATVQTWLLQEIDKPALVLVQYTYEGTSWPDRSLGCPSEGRIYQAGTVHGYRWTFEFDNRVRYEVHSSLDGQIAVLCSAVNAGADVSLTSYRGPDFSILSPEAWLAFPEAEGVLFAPQEALTCEQPGMRVIVMGRVANGVTPDQLLDDYLEEAAAEEAPAARETIGSSGRTTTFTDDCDGAPRHRRVTAFVEYGSAYRVEQWTPQAEVEKWDSLFLDMLSRFRTPDGAAAATDPAAPADADVDAPAEEEVPGPGALPALPLAHVFVGDVFVGALNDIPGRGVTITPATERRYLSFSPDGLFIAYINTTEAQLRVMNAAAGRSPRRMALDVRTDFPPAWSPDSQWIAYVADTGETDDDGAAVLSIEAVHRLSNQSRTLAEFAYTPGDDCPAESSDPADHVLRVDSGAGYTLAWLAGDRWLVSVDCADSLALLDPANEQVIALGEDLSGGVLAPDHEHFAARTPTGLVVINFTTWQRDDLRRGADAKQIAWSADGAMLYYTTEALADNTDLADSADEERGEAVFGTWPVTVRVYDLALVRVPVAGGAETVLWEGRGRGIGRIAPAPDGSGVLFSLVPAGLRLAEAFQAGAEGLALQAAWPEPVLYWLPAEGERAFLLAYAGQPAFAPVTVSQE